MRVLALTETRDHVCGRYRVRAFEPALNAAGWDLTLLGIERGLLGRLRQIDGAAEHDTVVVQRKLLPGWQLDLLRRRARRLVFDFDDAILHRDSNDPRGPRSLRRERRFRRTVQAADVVIAGNEFLAESAAAHGAARDRIVVIPTCIATERYSVLPRPEVRDRLELVWIGSSSTLAGLESRRMLWERVGREIVGVRLSLICDRSADFGPLPILPIAWDEATEADEIARADLGVSWIPDDLWSRGKCGLKVLQYQAAGLPVVANPVGVHPAMIHHGENGYLAGTDEEWLHAIRSLRDDPGLRARMGSAARRDIEANYSVAAWAPRFVGTIANQTTTDHAMPRTAKPGPKGVETRSRATRIDQMAGW